jgi:hypothetical protein
MKECKRRVDVSGALMQDEEAQMRILLARQ